MIRVLVSTCSYLLFQLLPADTSVGIQCKEHKWVIVLVRESFGFITCRILKGYDE